MLTLLIIVLIVVGMFKMTDVLFRVTGKIFGGIISMFGWLVMAQMVIALLGAAASVLPLFLFLGVLALIIAAC